MNVKVIPCVWKVGTGTLRAYDIRSVACHLGVSWDLVKEIQKHNLRKRYRLPKLAKVKRIAIDEIYQGKKLGYLTIVLDLQRGAVILLAMGKVVMRWFHFGSVWNDRALESKRLQPIWASLHQRGTDSYPEATLVFDHFHIIKLFNEKLTKLRRDLQREAKMGWVNPFWKAFIGCCSRTLTIWMTRAMSVNVWMKH